VDSISKPVIIENYKEICDVLDNMNNNIQKVKLLIFDYLDLLKIRTITIGSL
jgi:hypothetical protein